MLITGKYAGTLSIPKDNTTKYIALLLKKDSFILDPVGFSLIVRLKGDEKALKSGEYNLKNIHTVFDIIDTLKKGVLPEEIKVTIPEGFTVKDIAKRLYEKGVIKDKNLFIKDAKPYEGYLFPDTYMFINNMKDADIINKMKTRFKEVLPKDIEEKVKEKGLTLREVVILASIVEKEARFDQDRPLVASVFLNRLKIGMKLEADSTIVYLLPEHKQELSEKDMEIDSPYNTYKYKGLPPGPICNPGLKSILAVLNAPHTDYYYFITTPEGKGVFEETLQEHNRDIAKYYGG